MKTITDTIPQKRIEKDSDIPNNPYQYHISSWFFSKSFSYDLLQLVLANSEDHMQLNSGDFNDHRLDYLQ